MADPVWFGYNLPFNSNAGVLPLQADERIIKNDLLSLLLTTPGQRVMRPSFGTEINLLQFEQMTDEALDQLRTNIINAIRQHEPRVVLQDVQVEEAGVANMVNIRIRGYTTIAKNKLFEIELGLNLTGGELEEQRVR